MYGGVNSDIRAAFLSRYFTGIYGDTSGFPKTGDGITLDSMKAMQRWLTDHCHAYVWPGAIKDWLECFYAGNEP